MPVTNYGLRNDGTKKDIGFLGELKRPDGNVSTELSIGTEIDGKEREIPTLVPTLNDQERNYLLSVPENKIFTTNPDLYKQIQQKAVDHAINRINQNKSPFYTTGIDDVQQNKTHIMPTEEQTYDQAPQPLDWNKAYGEWKNGGKPIVDAIMNNYTKPVPEITPEQAQKAKFGSALMDTFSSLAEMFAHGQGARVRNREGATNTQMTNARIKGMNDQYKQEMQQYNGTKTNAELQDFNRKMETDRYNENAKRTYYLNKQQQESKAAALARQITKDNADAELRKQGLGIQSAAQKATAQHYSNSEAIDKENANTSRLNSQKYTGSLTGATPENYIQVNEKAETLPKDWVVQKGYMIKTVGKDRKTPSYSWDLKATPAIKKALIEMYIQEGNKPASTQQTSGVQWKIPAAQKAKKTIQGF